MDHLDDPKTGVRTVSKSAFKPKAFEYFRWVERSGRELIVTERGVPVLKIVPFGQLSDDAILEELAGSVTTYREPLESTGEIWDAEP